MIRWDRVAAVVMHPTQRRILQYLDHNERASAVQIVRALDIGSLPSVSYHMTALAKRGLIEEVDSRPVRGAIEHFYALSQVTRA